MKKLIFGSTAAKFFFPDFRTPKDLDFISKEGFMSREEQHYYWPCFDWILENNVDPFYVDAESLYAIKAAQSAFYFNWDKTVSDLFFFQKKGLSLNVPLYKSCLKDFTAHYGKKHATLEGKDSKAFFADHVVREYDHDSLHMAIAYYEEPLYFRIQKNENTVACCQKKFDNLSFEDKLKVVYEECMVTALERFLIPNNFEFSVQRAYALSLKKLFISMSSGWFRQFIIENYIHLWKCPDRDFITKFHTSNKLIKL